jgi:CDP-paratose 2-epimerase
VAASLEDPYRDFTVNALGTLEVLEALRSSSEPPPLVYTSTSKVYGSLADIAMRPAQTRWEPVDPDLRDTGIDEGRPLDLRTPYSCSKGSADQYVLDFAHTYRLPATVLRVSSVYGPRQLGTDDQEWVASCVRRVLARETITVGGDGRQVRDVLFIDDLVDALECAWTGITAARGHAFNIGGGARYTLSVMELLVLLEKLGGTRPHVRYVDWRPGDQRYYASDTRAFTSATGWRPRIGPHAGIEAMYAWFDETRAGGTLHG